MTRHADQPVSRWYTFTVLAIVALAFLAPLIWMVSTSIKPEVQAASEQIRSGLGQRVRALCHKRAPAPTAPAAVVQRRAADAARVDLLAIAASTGGPNALTTLLCAGCLAAGPGERAVRPTVLPRPVGCAPVAVGEPLAERLAAAQPGDTLCLADGVHLGPIALPAGVTLWGSGDAVVRSSGEGTTVRLGSGSRLLGLTVDGAGARADLLDAAVKAEKVDDVRIEGVTVVRANFGILLEQVKRAAVLGNRVTGIGGVALGLRGDGIRLWETYDSRIERNVVADARDVVVWYSSRNVLADNVVRHSRYGTHFMYSHDNRVERSQYLANEVGVFVMYSRGVVLDGNVLLDASGAAGMGIGMKESGNLTVTNNRLVHNSIGLFLDNSPLTVGERNRFAGNEIRDNHRPVIVESGGDALQVTWAGNAFDDYVGYDLDGDGFGDVPYALSDLGNALEMRNADLAFLRGTPALALVSLAGHAVPLFAPKPVLVDPKPRLSPLEQRHAT
jgi:nitrous oxidase accessory protein